MKFIIIGLIFLFAILNLIKRKEHFSSDEYRLGEAGTENCPNGYSKITSLDECKAYKNASNSTWTWFGNCDEDMKRTANSYGEDCPIGQRMEDQKHCHGRCGADWQPKNCYIKDGKRSTIKCYIV